ncbi:MAG: SOS response-associated peptidase, partial [Candidatus Caldarchaeum sp.]
MTDIDTLADRFGFETFEERLRPRYNVAPGQLVYVIVHDGVRRMRGMEWGLVPPWLKGDGKAYRMINVRAETLAENRALGHLISRSRCMVPADGFYEWKKEGGRKIPMRIALKTGEP